MSAVVPNVALLPPGLAPATVAGAQSAPALAPAGGSAFGDVLAQRAGATQAPRFSRHALERVNRRGISLDPATLQRLTGGMSRAAAKGSRDAVVFVDSTAFVVSVPNNTVVTAVGSEHMREHVFTNIDSAVIA